MSHKDAFKKAGELWGTLTDKEKEPWVKMQKKDEERMQRQNEELAKKGYFTMEDGTKSTDAYMDPKKKFGPDVVLPKKPISAYLAFAPDAIKKIRAEKGCS